MELEPRPNNSVHVPDHNECDCFQPSVDADQTHPVQRKVVQTGDPAPQLPYGHSYSGEPCLFQIES